VPEIQPEKGSDNNIVAGMPRKPLPMAGTDGERR
jgi:hypothetical protein